MRDSSDIRTALEAAVGVGDVCAEDNLIEEGGNIFRPSVLLQLLVGLREHRAQESVPRSSACAVEDEHPRTFVAGVSCQ